MHANSLRFCKIMTELMSHDSVCVCGGIVNIGLKLEKEGEEGRVDASKNKVYNF